MAIADSPAFITILADVVVVFLAAFIVVVICSAGLLLVKLAGRAASRIRPARRRR